MPIVQTPGVLSEQALGAPPHPGIGKVCAQHPYPLMLMSVCGSHLYGFPSQDSDTDLRGIYALPTDELVGLTHGPERLEPDPWGDDLLDVVTYEVRKVCLLLLSRNGNMLELLFSPFIVAESPWSRELASLASLTITRYHEKHYRGFALGEWNKLKQPAIREKRGLKHLLYLYRVLLSGIFLLRTGVVEANLPSLLEMLPTPGVAELLLRKQEGSEHMGVSEEELHSHQANYHHLLDQLYDSSQDCDHPAEVSEATIRALDDFVKRAHREAGQ